MTNQSTTGRGRQESRTSGHMCGLMETSIRGLGEVGRWKAKERLKSGERGKC